MGDPAHRAVEQVTGAARVELAEAQRVEHRDGPRPQGEYVAEDPADPRRRPLEGLHRAGMVVGLDLEGDRVAAAYVDRAGVLAGSHHHPLTLRGQPPQQLSRVLVGAVLGPQQREHRQLDAVRLARQHLADPLVLVLRKTEINRPPPPQLCVRGRRGSCNFALRFGERRGVWLCALRFRERRGLRREDAHTSAPATLSKRRRPSVEPVSASTACSGWGIRPSTLPASLRTPAMSRAEPLGFCPGA